MSWYFATEKIKLWRLSPGDVLPQIQPFELNIDSFKKYLHLIMVFYQLLSDKIADTDIIIPYDMLTIDNIENIVNKFGIDLQIQDMQECINSLPLKTPIVYRDYITNWEDVEPEILKKTQECHNLINRFGIRHIF